MKFKNITNKVMPFKKNGKWIDVQPEEIVELGENAKSIKGLEVIKSETKKSNNNNNNNNNNNHNHNKSKNVNLYEMTKDELNDYAAIIGYTKLNTSRPRDEMIKLIMEYKNEKF